MATVNGSCLCHERSTCLPRLGSTTSNTQMSHTIQSLMIVCCFSCTELFCSSLLPWTWHQRNSSHIEKIAMNATLSVSRFGFVQTVFYIGQHWELFRAASSLVIWVALQAVVCLSFCPIYSSACVAAHTARRSLLGRVHIGTPPCASDTTLPPHPCDSPTRLSLPFRTTRARQCPLLLLFTSRSPFLALATLSLFSRPDSHSSPSGAPVSFLIDSVK